MATKRTTDDRLVTADGQKFSLIMQSGVAKTEFYKWIASKTKDELMNITIQCGSFFNRDYIRFQIGANNHYIENSANPDGYNTGAKLTVDLFRKAWLKETIADPYLLNESAKNIWIGLTLHPKISLLSDESQTEAMATIIDNHLILTRMKDDTTPEFYTTFDRITLMKIPKIAQGFSLPRPHNLHGVISTDLLMQVEMELGNVDERDLHEGLLMNGVVGKTLLETQQIQQAIATLKIQGAWGTKDGIARAIHDRFKVEVDKLIQVKGATFKTKIAEEYKNCQ